MHEPVAGDRPSSISVFFRKTQKPQSLERRTPASTLVFFWTGLRNVLGEGSVGGLEEHRMIQKTTASPAGSGGRRKKSRCRDYGGQHGVSNRHGAAGPLGPVRGSDMAAGEGQTRKTQAGRRGELSILQ